MRPTFVLSTTSSTYILQLILLLLLSSSVVVEAFAPTSVCPTPGKYVSLSCQGKDNLWGFNLNHPEANSARCTSEKRTETKLYSSRDDKNNGKETSVSSQLPVALQRIKLEPVKCTLFSMAMASCGAALGPFLDSYHSAFGVLQYDTPIYFTLWGSDDHPALTTAWWVPGLFGLAGFIIGWLYIILDAVLLTGQDSTRENQSTKPSPPFILIGIAFFTFQYWLSGVLYTSGFDRSTILTVVTALCSAGFLVFDGSASGLIASLATAIGGPMIEVALITYLAGSGNGYHYTDIGETGFFPLWILPGKFISPVYTTCSWKTEIMCSLGSHTIKFLYVLQFIFSEVPRMETWQEVSGTH